MKPIFYAAAAALLFAVSGCKYAEGDGPDRATPRKPKTERQKAWILEHSNREKVSDYDINHTGGNDNFQVFPHRNTKRRSESLNDDFNTFPW